VFALVAHPFRAIPIEYFTPEAAARQLATDLRNFRILGAAWRDSQFCERPPRRQLGKYPALGLLSNAVDARSSKEVTNVVPT